MSIALSRFSGIGITGTSAAGIAIPSRGSQVRPNLGSVLNKLLALYDRGYELSVDGEILALPEDGFAPLLEAGLPQSDPQNVTARVAAAQTKFRRYRSVDG